MRTTLTVLFTAALMWHLMLPASARQEQGQFLSGGKIVHVELYIPDGKGTFPVVLLLYGRGGMPEDRFKGFADQLAAQGIGAAALNYFDAAPPPSPRFMRPWLKAGQEGWRCGRDANLS